MTNSETAILRTLAYADVFDYPLTRPEIWRYLIGKKIMYQKFDMTLKSLVSSRRVHAKNGYFTLCNRGKIIRRRLKLNRVAKAKIRLAQKVARQLKLIPAVWFVGISGALAMQNAPFDDDVDLFIITAPGSLWVTRLFCVVLLDIQGLRRRPNDRQYKDRICLNMFLDAALLILPKSERDLYSAHELVQLKPLVNKFSVHEKFLQANRWCKEYLPHAVKKSQSKQMVIKEPNRIVFSGKINDFARKIQLKYMAKRRTREVVKNHLLKFHPEDAREWVMDKYRLRLEKLGLRNDEVAN